MQRRSGRYELRPLLLGSTERGGCIHSSGRAPLLSRDFWGTFVRDASLPDADACPFS